MKIDKKYLKIRKHLRKKCFIGKLFQQTHQTAIFDLERKYGRALRVNFKILNGNLSLFIQYSCS